MKKTKSLPPAPSGLRKGVLFSSTLCLMMSSGVLQAQTPPAPAKPASDEIITLEEFGVEESQDPNFILPTQPIEGAIGFAKPVVETPRSVSVVSSEMLASMAISEVSDLSRIVPNANTTTRWGIQGNIDIRNMTADTYFRGMKRIEPQGNSRTVLAANDQVEVVRGPAPAYFGSGKIGGYTNMTPKSGRSRAGAYLDESTGFAEFTFGDYGKRIGSFGYGGALKLSEDDKLPGGYYIFALIEDSDSYYENVPLGQRVIQGAISKEISKTWRLETGVNYQETKGAGGFLNRLSQELIDDGIYWGGSALVTLDADGSGKISEREMVLGSPVGASLGAPGVGGSGSLGSTNRALVQRFGAGTAYQAALDSPIIPTGATATPNSALAALEASNSAFVDIMEADLPRYGDNLKLLNVLPQGFVLDPDEVRATEADYHHVALEKELFAKLGLLYLDFVNDKNPDSKMKNQILFDSQDQFKDSELPFYQKQDVWVVEDKFTLEHKLADDMLPGWLGFNTITAVNVRYTDASRRFNSGDYDDRPDLSLADNTRTPDDTFVSPAENSDYFNGGAPFSGDINTTYQETGIGTMFDVEFFEKVSLLVGGRLDYIQAETVVPAGLYSVGTNGSFTTTSSSAYKNAQGEGDDLGKSYTISLSGKAPLGLIPYITYGQQTALSDSSDLTLAGNLVKAGPYDAATLTEVGIKGNFLNGKLYAAVAAYQQERSTVTADASGSPLVGGLGNVKGEGIEIEFRYAPNKNFWVGGFSVFQKTELVFSGTEFVRVHGEPLGFTDVLAPDGSVLYPAEAFTQGGVVTTPVAADVNTEHPAYPNTSHGLQAQYTFDSGFLVSGSGNYISEVHSGRLQTVKLPEAYTFNVGLGYKKGDWGIKLDVKNITDEQWFRGRNGTTAGDVLVSAMPGRSYQITVTKQF
jgi:iron complex outermembrane receptor protein